MSAEVALGFAGPITLPLGLSLVFQFSFSVITFMFAPRGLPSRPLTTVYWTVSPLATSVKSPDAWKNKSSLPCVPMRNPNPLSGMTTKIVPVYKIFFLSALAL